MGMNTPAEYCARCRRPAPDELADEFLEWEASVPPDENGEAKVICPGCVTLGEERGIADDASETAEVAGPGAIAGQGPADKATAALMGMFATELENLGGIDASRIKAILRGAEATDDEVERIGYACIEVMRALQ